MMTPRDMVNKKAKEDNRTISYIYLPLTGVHASIVDMVTEV